MKMVPVDYELTSPWYKFSPTLSIVCIHSFVHTQPQPVHSTVPSLYPTPRAIKYLPTKIRRNQTSCHLNNKRLHPAFNKPQIPKSIWIKVFDYQFPSNPRPRPSVDSADRRVGLCCSQQGGIPPRFPSLKLMQRSFSHRKEKKGPKRIEIAVSTKHHTKTVFQSAFCSII